MTHRARCTTRAVGYSPPIQLSTAISDGVLAVVTIAAALPVIFAANPTRRFGGVCLFFLGLTAAVGAFRFAGYDVALFHQSMAWTSRMIVLPAIGAVFVALSLQRRIIRPYWYGLCLVLGGIGWLLPPSLSLVPSVTAMAMIFVVAARHLKEDPALGITAMAGVVITMMAGLVIGTKGELGPMLRVDAFHYVLAIAHACFGFAMLRFDRDQSRG